MVTDIGKDEIMRYGNLYTKLILTIIAALLAWNTFSRFFVPAVHAQPASPQYAVEQLTTDRYSWDKQALETALNNAAKGRELVTVAVSLDHGVYLAVYKQQSR